MNDYFNYSQNILPGSIARSQPITHSFDAIARAFELMPNPIKSSMATKGFSQSVQVGPAEQANHAATLGQVQQIVDAVTGNNPLADGSLHPVFRGDYSPTASYEPMEFVGFSGGLYVNILASSGIDPSDSEHWLLVMSPLNIGVVWYELLSGNASPPLIAYHDNSYWMLIMSLPDVAVAVPGSSPAWQRIPEETVYIQRPSIISPADGDEGFAGVIEGSEYATGPRFSGALTKSVWQASLASDFSTIYAEDELTSGDMTDWTIPLPDPLVDVWVRVRYESGGFSSSWSHIVKATIADYRADPPTFISPVDMETDWHPLSTIQITAYAPNLPDDHESTNWKVLDGGGQVVWQSLGNTQNLTSISIPSGVLSPDTTYTLRVSHVGQFFGEQDAAEISVTTLDDPGISLDSPLDNESELGPRTTLKIGPINNQFDHTATQWRVYLDSDSTLVYDSGEVAGDAESYTLSTGVLVRDETYRWESRAKTAEYGWGAWSTQRSFSTGVDFPPTRKIAALPSTSDLNITGIDSDSNYVYLSHRSGDRLTIINKSDGSAVSGTPHYGNALSDVCVDSSYVYLADEVLGLKVIDKSDWSTVSGVSAPGDVGSVASDSNYVYFAHHGGFAAKGLWVVDKSDWNLVSGTPTLPSPGNGVFVDSSYVYVAQEQGFLVIDKSDWSIVSGTPTVPGVCKSVHADSDYVYVARPDGLVVIDKSGWSIVSGVPSLSSLSVHAESTYVYLARGSKGFSVIDKSDWSIVSGTPTVSGSCNAVHVDSDYSYAGHAGGRRLSIME